MGENPTIRVVIVDDHDMVRKGLIAFLKVKPDLELVGEASNGLEAIRVCERVQPDVVLMDLLMPEMDGTSATETIRKRWPRIQVIALTSFQERELVKKAFAAGAISYLLKNVSVDELARAIRAAFAGQATLAPEATQALIQSAGGNGGPGDDLTEREQEVLSLLADGMSNPQIADLTDLKPVVIQYKNDVMLVGQGTVPNIRGQWHWHLTVNANGVFVVARVFANDKCPGSDC